MIVSDFAFWAAAGSAIAAVLLWSFTQIHLVRVARRLVRKSDESWARAHAEIAQVKSDVLAEMQRISEKGGGEELRREIHDIDQRIESAFSQFNGRVAQSFDSFGGALTKQLEDRFSAITSRNPIERMGASPQDAQLEGAASKQAKKIVQVIKAQALGPEIQQLGEFLRFVGYDDLADKLADNPEVVNAVLKHINADSWLRGRMGQFMGGARGAPNNGPGRSGPI